ncbi:MAG TPA: tetratricopeptide repeat protein [Myxococcaceae bacterium]|nr:tetratricopeptide repeat protein [Myxococcaceae bacterium]
MAETEEVKDGDWKKRESLPSALVQIGVATAVLVVGVVFYIHRGTHRKEVADQIKTARETALRDNPADLEKAMHEVEAILAIDPKAPDALAFAADIQTELWLTHQVPGAEAKARQFLRDSETSGKDYEDRYGSKALQWVADGKPAEAEQLIEDLRKRGASSGKLWFGLAYAYQAEGNLTLEKQAFFQATEKNWKNPRYDAAYAEALIDEGQIDQALDVAKKGVANNPDHYRSRLALAIAQARKKEHVKDAADTIKDVLSHESELTPGLKVRAYVATAEVALFAQQPDDALAASIKALSVDPNSYRALWARARAQAAKKDPGALASFKAAAGARKSGAAIYFDGADSLEQNGDTAGALALLNAYEQAFKGVTYTTTDGKTLDWVEHDDRYWIARGDILKASGKPDEALASYDKAVAAGSINLAKAHYAKGALFLARKDYDKATSELKLVTPEDGTGHLAEAYLAMGETLFAKKDYPTGCQNYAFALARLKNLQTPREKLNAILEDVNKRLIVAGQSPVAKLWMQEAKPIIQ